MHQSQIIKTPLARMGLVHNPDSLFRPFLAGRLGGSRPRGTTSDHRHHIVVIIITFGLIL